MPVHLLICKKRGIIGINHRVPGGEPDMGYVCKDEGGIALPPSGNQDGDPHPDHHTNYI